MGVFDYFQSVDAPVESYASVGNGEMSVIPASTPATDAGGLPSWITQGANLFTTAVNTYDNFANSVTNRQVTQYNAETNAQIAKLQADYALSRAQAQVKTAAIFDAANINQALANLSHRMGVTSGTDKTMLILTVIGLGIAWMQYAKRK